MKDFYLTQSQIQTDLNNRKQTALIPISEGLDESDYYFCPTCYAIIGVHDDDAVERDSYCPNCGQKLTWQEYHEKRMRHHIKCLIHDGLLEIEKKEGMLFCYLLKEISFAVPASPTVDDDQNIHNIAVVLMHPGAFGISQEVMDSIRTILWKE